MAYPIVPISGTENNYYKPNWTTPQSAPPVGPGPAKPIGSNTSGGWFRSSLRSAPNTVEMGSTGGNAGRWLGSGEQWGKMLNVGDQSRTLRMDPPTPSRAMRLGGAALAVPMGAYNAVQGASEGDTGRAALGAADAAAGAALLTPAAPAAAAYLGVRGAYEGGKAAGEWASNRLGETARDAIGGTVNTVANWFGGGVDDNALRTLNAGLDVPKTPWNARITPPEASAPAASPALRQPYSDARNGTAVVPASDPTGKIMRDGNSYGGKDVKFGAEIVAPGMEALDAASGVKSGARAGYGVSSLDTREGYRQNLLELQRNAAERAAAPVGGVGNLGTSTGLRLNDTVAANKAAGATRAERIAMAEFAAKRDMNAANVGAQIYGVDTGAATSRYGTDTQAATLRRGQDMDYAEKIDARMMDLAAKRQLRDAYGSALKATNGNFEGAAAILTSAGIDAKPFLDMARYGTERQTSGEKALDRTLEGLASKDGKVDAGRLAQLRTQLKTMADMRGVTPEQLHANEPDLLRQLNLLEGMNQLGKNTLSRRLGLDPVLRRDALPNLNGYTAEQLNVFNGTLNPTTDAKAGDWRLRRSGAEDIYVPEAAVGEHGLDYLSRRGAKIPGR